ncbi:MAG: 23S rRNA (pseudouridine(1915)-N(3))-methyltransferase RlmH [Thermodesulfovibrionales bacterium]|nr:23S rRNA (pseudouridine(1915)-N(3))-methyltransferase RlmH [Thermodesulfovibrionales bacterium]
MMHIRVIYPGRTKEGFIKDGISKYIKLLRPYVRIETIELKSAGGLKEQIITLESRALLKTARHPFCLLDREGIELTSEEFAQFLKDRPVIDFLIGGAFGVSEELKRSAPFKLSLSRFTFTHELSRLILFEQLYRAMTIIKGREYHY